MQRHLRLLALAAALILAGCAAKVQTVHESPDFVRQDVVTGRLAVGGVVLASRLEADPTVSPPDGLPRGDVLAQSEAWAPTLYGALLSAEPQPVVWPWLSVRDACPDSVLADALLTFARGGVLRATQVRDIAASLADIRYLLLGRVEGDELMLHEGAEAVVGNQRAKDGRDVHGSPLDPALKTRRKVTVSLDVYDLSTGRSIWTATVSRYRDELYNFADDGTQGRPPVVPAGEPVITAGGKPLPAADFTRILADACGALARRLIGGTD